MPFIISWPGVIPAGKVNDQVASQMDLLPTFSHLIGSPLSANKIDGEDIWPLLTDRPEAITPRRALYFFIEEELESARLGDLKYHLPHMHRCSYDHSYVKGAQGVICESLFDLLADPKESVNIIESLPASLADSCRRAVLGWRKQFYLEQRPVGKDH